MKLMFIQFSHFIPLFTEKAVNISINFVFSYGSTNNTFIFSEFNIYGFVLIINFKGSIESKKEITLSIFISGIIQDKGFLKNNYSY